MWMNSLAVIAPGPQRFGSLHTEQANPNMAPCAS
jgi:hypothetical protein